MIRAIKSQEAPRPRINPWDVIVTVMIVTIASLVKDYLLTMRPSASTYLLMTVLLVVTVEALDRAEMQRRARLKLPPRWSLFDWKCHHLVPRKQKVLTHFTGILLGIFLHPLLSLSFDWILSSDALDQFLPLESMPWPWDLSNPVAFFFLMIMIMITKHSLIRRRVRHCLEEHASEDLSRMKQRHVTMTKRVFPSSAFSDGQPT